jgi:F0F1-type ATP synthase assembly protein I
MDKKVETTPFLMISFLVIFLQAQVMKGSLNQ